MHYLVIRLYKFTLALYKVHHRWRRCLGEAFESTYKCITLKMFYDDDVCKIKTSLSPARVPRTYQSVNI